MKLITVKSNHWRGFVSSRKKGRCFRFAVTSCWLRCLSERKEHGKGDLSKELTSFSLKTRSSSTKSKSKFWPAGEGTLSFMKWDLILLKSQLCHHDNRYDDYEGIELMNPNVFSYQVHVKDEAYDTFEETTSKCSMW